MNQVLPPNPNPNILDLSGVGRQFGALVAVAGIDLHIKRQERRAMLGSNGAGKTTLFNLMTGDIPVSQGTIHFKGADVTVLKPQDRVRRGLRRTYQISQLFGLLSVRENVYLAARGIAGNRFSLIRTQAKDALMQEAENCISAVHLDDAIETEVGNLSHGQQRQLEIAMALVGKPELILFDEPAAGLSPTERRDLVRLLKGLPQEIGFIIIEHDMDVALQVADLVSVMHDGRIFKEGTPDEIENDDAVQALYLGDGHG